MGKTYTYTFYSSIGLGATNINKQYNVDWSKLPNKPFKVSFSFCSSYTLKVGTTKMMLFADLGQTTTIASSLNGPDKNYPCGFLGFLYDEESTAVALRLNVNTDRTYNAPIWIDTRPVNNNLTILINNNIAQVMNPSPMIPAFYTLTLYFEEQD